ncbi:MAG: [Fe-Fe] hydrogenase large subunit C-terminal domain-containing protein, partial [Armatimonadota bacterium]
MPEPQSAPPGVVSTIAAKCRRCYNCVRSCPAKAIRVHNGQAEVLAERCLGCGNCLRVCGQDAKQVQSSVAAVQAMLAAQTATAPVIAVLAPSYPVAFDSLPAERLVGALRKLGFARVMEVGFGAEIVAERYAKLLANPPDYPVLSSPCPALVSYVEKYLPELTRNLAPIASPMIALGRAVKERYQPGAQVVFIGPCVAKKMEILDPAVAGAIEAVMTFQELEQLFDEAGVIARAAPPSDPDPPLPHYGSLFPVSGGLLKAAAIQADLMDDSIVVVEGAERCLSALLEVKAGNFTARFLDLLFCEGCIAGPSYVGSMTPLARRERITAHVRRLREQAEFPAAALAEVRDLDVTRSYGLPPINVQFPNYTELRDILAKTDKYGPEDELNCGACGYATCREKAIAVYQGLAESEMCLPYLIDQMQINLEKLGRSKEEIEKAREQAARAQELASMGQLASDIAHEISTPLTQVVVFAQLLRDSMAEDDPKREDLAAIVAESLHARDVMAGLKGFARQRQPAWEETSLAAIVDQALAEAKPQLEESEAKLTVDLAPDLPPLIADPGLLQQVLVNLINNSLDTISGPGEIAITGRLTADRRSIELLVRDTGSGIPTHLLPQ